MIDHIKAHDFCRNHKVQLLNSKQCGCFYCCNLFPPERINFWLDEWTGSAICPICGTDSVIGDSSVSPLTEEFLQKMNKHRFNT